MTKKRLTLASLSRQIDTLDARHATTGAYCVELFAEVRWLKDQLAVAMQNTAVLGEIVHDILSRAERQDDQAEDMADAEGNDRESTTTFEAWVTKHNDAANAVWAAMRDERGTS
jgi:hypothetical protein